MPSPFALTPRAVRLLMVGVVVLLGLSAYRLLFAPPPGPYLAFSGTSMGTTWQVKVASSELGPNAMREVGAEIEKALSSVVDRMSTWEPDSELSRFNASDSTHPVPISKSTLEVLQIAEAVSQRSDSAFDVTVGPLVEAWGFGTADAPHHLPSQQELTSLQANTGHGLLVLDPAAVTLQKMKPAVQVDVSAIAKGYAVDRIAEALEGIGYFNYLVEVGGEMRARGRRLDGRVWRVAIEEPTDGVQQIHRVLQLEDMSLATSGDYRNFYERDGRRISHTLDPRTAQPVDHGLASVSVLHASATWADAWATALNVLGPDAGLALARREGLAAYFILRTGTDQFDVRATPPFERYWVAAPSPSQR